MINSSITRRELFRIGSPLFANESRLRETTGFDALFHDYHEFVYIADFHPWLRVNGTWQGALASLLNDPIIWIDSPSCS
jgi:hypothetical protein